MCVPVCTLNSTVTEAVFKTWKVVFCLFVCFQWRVSHGWGPLEFLVMVKLTGRLTLGQPHYDFSYIFCRRGAHRGPPSGQTTPTALPAAPACSQLPFLGIPTLSAFPTDGWRTTFSFSQCLIWLPGPWRDVATAQIFWKSLLTICSNFWLSLSGLCYSGHQEVAENRPRCPVLLPFCFWIFCALKSLLSHHYRHERPRTGGETAADLHGACMLGALERVTAQKPQPANTCCLLSPMTSPLRHATYVNKAEKNL